MDLLRNFKTNYLRKLLKYVYNKQYYIVELPISFNKILTRWK